MKKKKECSITGIMIKLSKKWTLIILNELSTNGKRRFNELMENAEGISARTLSKRLKELEKAELITKKSFKETPPRVEYSLTNSGKELIKCFNYLNKWVIKWEKKS
ncbi:helix-turn-helix transcriptional regulator [Candidatus Pacearchaeota archaeon]|nr:helix-turn-helix transcriptional regulator [Candidatus Pacearchaeota archaeon]